MEQLKGKNILITGGTGSLGTHLVKRLLEIGNCNEIVVFSRDEAKQYEMKQKYPVKYVLGDVRHYDSVYSATLKADIVFHTAALKQVGACEDNPWEAVLTNIYGVHNIIEAAKMGRTETVIGVSSDKGCQPVNMYGTTKYAQERLLIQANKDSTARFISVLYGNVILSRGSVMELWKGLIADGKPIKINNPNMTRFLISLDLAVDTLLAALCSALPGEVYIPYGLPSATVGDIADVMINGRDIKKKFVGIQFGEKMDEILVAASESNRTLFRDGYLVLSPLVQDNPAITGEYNSKDHLIPKDALKYKFATEVGL